MAPYSPLQAQEGSFSFFQDVLVTHNSITGYWRARVFVAAVYVWYTTACALVTGIVAFSAVLRGVYGQDCWYLAGGAEHSYSNASGLSDEFCVAASQLQGEAV